MIIVTNLITHYRANRSTVQQAFEYLEVSNPMMSSLASSHPPASSSFSPPLFLSPCQPPLGVPVGDCETLETQVPGLLWVGEVGQTPLDALKSGPGAAPDHPGDAPAGPGPVLKLLDLFRPWYWQYK